MELSAPRYVAERQVAFKEMFYGYSGAVAGWRRLQAAAPAPRPPKIFDFFEFS